jgi:hypothetical protein
MKHTALLAALFAVTATAGATDVGQHPAIFSPRSLPGIDPNTFIVGHPALGAPGKAEQTALVKKTVPVSHAHATVTASHTRATTYIGSP